MSNNEEAGTGAGGPPEFTLHIFPFSFYSIMTRLTYVFGNSGLKEEKLKMQLKLHNLHRNENLSSDHLLTVNPKGQVPALTGKV
ncbi:hypothetical protein BDP81DRAFT_438338 [Colletotrichum phormii]|uniref:GST N-terminal domain-containing protein n=1 Tax=Colletotrichum phormii TaxID=359342 RepID=A0AAI9ZG20_9PEZI|nr:uncharacterized protein BDP81DRAFT_438338 [Colletotrichum phormii]KAK1623903.1 hypothetical protein BDP81DRAFT_438338 [Colletotrichum phormii]